MSITDLVALKANDEALEILLPAAWLELVNSDEGNMFDW